MFLRMLKRQTCIQKWTSSENILNCSITSVYLQALCEDTVRMRIQLVDCLTKPQVYNRNEANCTTLQLLTSFRINFLMKNRIQYILQIKNHYSERFYNNICDYLSNHSIKTFTTNPSCETACKWLSIQGRFVMYF